jgi:hypothetical protein
MYTETSPATSTDSNTALETKTKDRNKESPAEQMSQSTLDREIVQRVEFRLLAAVWTPSLLLNNKLDNPRK